jgi:hypothetical protein
MLSRIRMLQAHLGLNSPFSLDRSSGKRTTPIVFDSYKWKPHPSNPSSFIPIPPLARGNAFLLWRRRGSLRRAPPHHLQAEGAPPPPLQVLPLRAPSSRRRGGPYSKQTVSSSNSNRGGSKQQAAERTPNERDPQIHPASSNISPESHLSSSPKPSPIQWKARRRGATAATPWTSRGQSTGRGPAPAPAATRRLPRPRPRRRRFPRRSWRSP